MQFKKLKNFLHHGFAESLAERLKAETVGGVRFDYPAPKRFADLVDLRIEVSFKGYEAVPPVGKIREAVDGIFTGLGYGCREVDQPVAKDYLFFMITVPAPDLGLAMIAISRYASEASGNRAMLAITITTPARIVI
jgi:hypothetical protein